MRRLFYIATLAAALVSGAASAGPQPIIIVISYHNLDYASSACSHTLDVGQLMPNDQQIIGAALECKLVGDARVLGRRLENAVIDQMAINTRCQGVNVFRENHAGYDGKSNYWELEGTRANFHWRLFLDFVPGQKTHGWTLFPTKGSASAGAMIAGEGAPHQIADQICTVATGRGATFVDSKSAYR